MAREAIDFRTSFLFCFLLPKQIGALKRLDESTLHPAVPVEVEDGNLVFVQTLWRHGDRNPNHHFPKDKFPVTEWDQGGTGLGQLTPVGMSQQRLLGQSLRKRYHSLVNERYVSNEIYIHSTDVNRTIISAMSNMIGFYNGAKAKKGVDLPSDDDWPNNFVPIPIHSQSLVTDYILGCPDDAKHADLVYKKLKSTKEYKELENKNKDFLDQLSKILGYESMSLSFIFSVYDTLFIEKGSEFIKNKPWPDGITEDIYKKAGDLAGVLDDYEDGIGISDQDGINFSTELAKINGGPLLNEMIEHLKAKTHCLDVATDRTAEDKRMCSFFDPLKYYVYSAHDTTLGSLFSTYGFKYTNWNTTGLCAYASCTALELWQKKGANNKNVYTIKVIYWPASVGPLELTSSVTGCEMGCTLQQFIDRSVNYTDDFVKYCNKNENNGAAIGFTATYCGVAAFFLISQWIVASRI
ncbi:Acid phosphatase [Aphelenchoides besseyi]|nr:Acid phosphatase [Aphelenchoides besseyi]KAI6195479.1 Acid phosphatase [Aphelenchoides besseyi]